MLHQPSPQKSNTVHNPGVHDKWCLSRGTRVGPDQLDFGFQSACSCQLRDNPPVANVPADKRRDVLACFEIALEVEGRVNHE